MQDLRERLIKFIMNAVGGCSRYWAGVIADGLMENGVTDNNDGRKWIPVTERLPNNLETVLCYTNFEEVRIWQWNERWNSWIGLVADYGKNVVTHWMPLPEAPKEDA